MGFETFGDADWNNISKKNIIKTYLYTEKQMECLQKSIDQYNERYEKRPLDIQLETDGAYITLRIKDVPTRDIMNFWEINHVVEAQMLKEKYIAQFKPIGKWQSCYITPPTEGEIYWVDSPVLTFPQRAQFFHYFAGGQYSFHVIDSNLVIDCAVFQPYTFGGTCPQGYYGDTAEERENAKQIFGGRISL